jgi:hypothetical protein
MKKTVIYVFTALLILGSMTSASFANASLPDSTSSASKKDTAKEGVKKITKAKEPVKRIIDKKKKINKKIEEKHVNIQKELGEENHWAYGMMSKLKSKGIISGYEDGTLKPDKSVTRAEFITIIGKILRLQEKSENIFEDIDSSKWYEEPMLKGKEAGIFRGYEINGKLLAKPNEYITREEACTMVVNAFKLDGHDHSKLTFKDSKEIASYARDNIGILVGNKYLSGYEDNTFKPKKLLSRAEGISILNNTMGELYNTKGTYKDKVISSNLVVNRQGIILENIKVKGNLYLTEGIGDGDVEINNSHILGKVFIEGGGLNSIYFSNSSVGEVVVAKKDGKVRVVLKDNTKVDSMKMEKNAKIEVMKDSNIKKLEIGKTVKEIEIKNEGKIDDLKVQGKEVKINGKKVAKNQKIYIKGKGIKKSEDKIDGKTSASKKRPSGGGGGGGGSSSSSSSSSSSKPEPDNGYKIIDTYRTEIMEIESVLYAVVTLKKGNVDGYEFYLDGKAVNMKRVNKQGTILKTEVSKKDIKELKVKNGNEEETFKFGEKDLIKEKEDLTIGDLIFQGLEFKETKRNDGAIENSIKLSIKEDKNVKFSSAINSGHVDGITGASIPKDTPVPAGLKLNINRLDDKNLELKMVGKATNHIQRGSKVIKLILLKDLFENIQDNFEGLAKEIHIKFN